MRGQNTHVLFIMNGCQNYPPVDRAHYTEHHLPNTPLEFFDFLIKPNC